MTNTNSEGRVFKVPYSPRDYVRRLWTAIGVHMMKRGAIDIKGNPIWDKSSLADQVTSHRYHERAIRIKINEIRVKHGLEPIALDSLKWFTEGYVLEGLEDYKYAKII
jgi:hypothetical protein|nr:MAG TPA: hypothetical protein [Caudoviricetes sp.]